MLLRNSQITNTIPNALETVSCIHCKSPVPTKRIALNCEDSQFCCEGCQFVFSLLNSRGLNFYYQLRDRVDGQKNKNPAVFFPGDYSRLDKPELIEKLSLTQAEPSVKFFLENVHCAACVWLVEKLPKLSDSIAAASLDLSTGVATVRLAPNALLSSVARTIESIGYRPHLLEQASAAEGLQKLENRAWLMRIGVAGACAGNIMILAVSVYAGASGFLGQLFNVLSLALFLPVLLYCSAPFYHAALAALRNKTLSIDVPIVVAIVLGTAVSALHTFAGSEHVYYDSISALVFLLLSSRYLLRRAQQKSLGELKFLQFLTPAFARVYDPAEKQYREVLMSNVLPGAQILVKQGELIPADGYICQGSSYLNVSVMTGEPLPQPVKCGDKVLSGSKNEGDDIEITVSASGVDTQLGKILKQLESELSQKAPIVQAADRISKWFLICVFLAATAVLFFNQDLSIGFNRALALLIVTCPCALALATPLTMSLALKRAAARGILIKKSETLEKLSRIKTIVLDKTGTLTSGVFKVLSWTEHENIPGFLSIVRELERISKHPIAKALSFHADRISESEDTLPVTVNQAREILGQGVEGFIDGVFYEIKTLSTKDHHQDLFQARVGVFRNKRLVCSIVLGDELRDDAEAAIKKLLKFKLPIFLLSGDRTVAVQKLAGQLGMIASNCTAEASPQQKQAFVLGQINPLMVGDGANDALALSSAYVSAAVQGSLEVSLQASDVYFSKPGVLNIHELITLGKNTMKVIHRNFAFSLAYNLAGGIAAATGHITPLSAALLMPMSAFTVLSSSLWGSRRLAQTTRKER